MPFKLTYLFFLLPVFFAANVFAQTYPTSPPYPGQQPQRPTFGRDTAQNRPVKKLTDEQELDSLRKKEDNKHDTVIFTAKFIRVTNEALLTDSTQVFKLDTTLANFENYSPLYQPRHPYIGLGNLGLPARPLLFEPPKTIGFDVGQHMLDLYMLNPEDIQYYKARVPYTSLYFVTGGTTEQLFKAVHTQNINPQLNVGFNLNFLGSNGFYAHQGVDNFNGAVFSWYQSKNKRYNLLANLIVNSIKAPENGSPVGDEFNRGTSTPFAKNQDPTKLINSADNWTSTGFYLKQFYYIGKLDSLKNGRADIGKVLPTQRVSYTFYYNARSYKFLQNEPDVYNVYPDYYFSSTQSKDSLKVTHFQNAFAYSFYLRGNSVGFIKNEAKIDVGLTQDLYHYQQFVSDSVVNNTYGRIIQQTKMQENTFQDITLRAKVGYRFSNKIMLDANLQQIAAGRDFGDYLYDARISVAGGNKTGRIVLEGYTQNSTPPLVYTNWVSNHFVFHDSFKNQKITNLSFSYVNNALKLDLKAEYDLINDYLFFAAQPNGIDATPTQLAAPVNLLKVSLGKSFIWRRWHFDDYLVYQKTDNPNVLRTPQAYNFASIYYNRLLFNVLNTNFGIDVRYNTPYLAPSYAVGLGQFYNNTPNLTFSSYPVATVFIKATLIRTNLFLMYDYANQGIFSKGYYMVNRYPGPDHLLKFGVSWTFYN
jgi:hypothetical protein